MLGILKFYIRIIIMASFLSFKFKVYPPKHSFDNFAMQTRSNKVEKFLLR